MKLHRDVLAYLPVLNNLMLALGIYIYENYFCEYYTFRKQCLILLPAMVVIQAFGAPLFEYGASMSLGVGVSYVVLFNILVGLFQGALQIPMFAMCAKICPDNIAATMFAVLTSIQNQALMGATQIGVGLQSAFGITSHSFGGLYAICLICAGFQLLPWFALHPKLDMLPDDLDQFTADLHAENEMKPMKTVE